MVSNRSELSADLTPERFFGSDLPANSMSLIQGMVELSKATNGLGVAVFKVRPDLPEWKASATRELEIHANGRIIEDEEGVRGGYGNTGIKLAQRIFEGTVGSPVFYCTSVEMLPDVVFPSVLGDSLRAYAEEHHLSLDSGISGVMIKDQ